MSNNLTYYQKNRERIIQKIKEYNRINKEKTKEYHKKYYQKNKERILLYRLTLKNNNVNPDYHYDYYEKNKQRINEYAKQYYQKYKKKRRKKRNPKQLIISNKEHLTIYFD